MSPDRVPPAGLDGEELSRFFARLEAASSCLLLLDYDGTLAPFREDPAEAVPYPEVLPPLGAILEEGSTRVVIVSGRSLESILPLLNLKVLPEVWGSHGREQRLQSGEVRQVRPSPEQLEGLAKAKEAVGSAGVPGRVEEKPFSLAFHIRGLPEAEGAESLAQIQGRWKPMAGQAGLEVLPFDGGLEIRAPGWNKGDVVNTLFQDVSGEIPSAYLGDDDTDEDAFRALEGRGLTVLVREEGRPSAARVWLRPPAELVGFLERWRLARSVAEEGEKG